MTPRLALLALILALPLAACDALLNEDAMNDLVPSVSEIAVSSATASSEAPLPPEDPTAPLESGDVSVTASGSAAVAAMPPEDPGFADDERVLDSGVLQLGDVNAPVLVTVYINHASPYSRAFTDDYLPKLLAGFVRRGELKLTIVSIPFQKYPNSRAEAAGLLCAARQGKGLAMHRALAALSVRTDASMRTAATDLAVDPAAFDACLRDPATSTAIDEQASLAASNGATLVPSFDFDAETEMVQGLMDYPDLRGRIERTLRH